MKYHAAKQVQPNVTAAGNMTNSLRHKFSPFFSCAILMLLLRKLSNWAVDVPDREEVQACDFEWHRCSRWSVCWTEQVFWEQYTIEGRMFRYHCVVWCKSQIFSSDDPIYMISHQSRSTEREFPVICLVARDYMAILASSCLAERSFSMSARTDDVHWHQMGSKKFRALQRLRAAYRDGHLKAVQEAWMEIGADFGIDIAAK